LVPIGEILIEKSLCLVKLKEDALEFLQLLRIAAVATNLCDFFSDGKDSLELGFKVLPQAIAYIMMS
jgi:hypothetical protein